VIIVRHGIEGLRSVSPDSVLSIGNFDGLHRGHQHLLQLAKSLRDDKKGSRIVVVTFEPHPLTVIRPALAPPRLSPLPIKKILLENAGVDELVVLPPTREVLDLSAEAFWRILRDEAKPAHLVEGPAFNFGRDRAGTIDRLREWASDSEIKLHIVGSVDVALLDLSVVSISSSLIRWLLQQGRVRDAGICLGRSYALEGEVIEGHRRGRQIGVPTANLRSVDQLIPADGVYAGACAIDGKQYSCAISIGILPTFEDGTRQVEAHLIGFNGDLYGKSIRLEFLDWVREQRRFIDVEHLKQRIAIDLSEIKSLGIAPRFEPIARAS
jgi:riboflavin kinase / FMN adenylyltransferase